MANSILFLPKLDRRLHIKIGSEILLCTNFPNNNITKHQNEKYLIHKKAQQDQLGLKALHSAKAKKIQSYYRCLKGLEENTWQCLLSPLRKLATMQLLTVAFFISTQCKHVGYAPAGCAT